MKTTANRRFEKSNLATEIKHKHFIIEYVKICNTRWDWKRAYGKKYDRYKHHIYTYKCE